MLKQIIEILGGNITETKIAEVNKARFFSDEVQDAALIEQTYICAKIMYTRMGIRMLGFKEQHREMMGDTIA